MDINYMFTGNNQMHCFVIILCLVLVGCQKSDRIATRSDSHQMQDIQLISNESDYLYVFNKMEAQIKSAPHRIDDRELSNYIVKILCQLSIDYCHQIRIYILENPEFNAYMLPNGAFIILTGLLLRIDDESQLAYVLAHELGHYVNKHGIKKINYSKFKNTQAAGTSQRFSTYMSLNKYTQDLEHQADLFGIELLADKQYDLNSVAMLYINLQQENRAAKKENKGGFDSTHPGTDRRISLIQKYASHKPIKIPDADNSWQQIKTAYINNWLNLELRKREFKSSLLLLERLKLNSTDPAYFDYFIGEIFRKQSGMDNQNKAVSYYLKHLDGNYLVDDIYKNLVMSMWN